MKCPLSVATFDSGYETAEALMRQALELDEDDYLLFTELVDLLRTACLQRADAERCPHADPRVR